MKQLLAYNFPEPYLSQENRNNDMFVVTNNLRIHDSYDAKIAKICNLFSKSDKKPIWSIAQTEVQ